MPSSRSADDTIIRDEDVRCSLLLDDGGVNDEENGTGFHNIRAVTSTRFVDVDIIFVCRTSSQGGGRYFFTRDLCTFIFYSLRS